MKHVMDFNIGSNQAGKGDTKRPKTKNINKELFRNREEVENTSICFICGKKWHRYFSIYSKDGKKILVYCEPCKNKIYE